MRNLHIIQKKLTLKMIFFINFSFLCIYPAQANAKALGADEAGDFFSESMAKGDFNGDGIMDLAVGTPGESPGNYPKSGAVFIYMGTKNDSLRPWHVILQSSPTPAGQARGLNEKGDEFGYSLS